MCRLFAVLPFLSLAQFATESIAASPNLTAQAIPPAELELPLKRGRELYIRNCFICHQLNGQGIAGIYPPLAKSDLLANNLERAIKAVVEGIWACQEIS
jgi:nitrite reductase (NO-forming)